MNTRQPASTPPRIVAFLVLSARYLGLHAQARRIEAGRDGEPPPARPQGRAARRRAPRAA
jgi:hypothetical protein